MLVKSLFDLLTFYNLLIFGSMLAIFVCSFLFFLPNLLRGHREKPLFTQSTVYLSVVVPAMNEKVLVIDDGSTDGTADIAVEYGKKFDGKLKVLKLERNLGKGGAVRHGVMHSSGKLILFADADGATRFSEIEKLERGLLRISGGPPVDESFPGVVVGSRAHLEAESCATRSLLRTILMHAFHALVWLFSSRTIKDTQCGFKLFTRASAAQICVTWQEVEGSKIVPFWSWLQMGRDLILIWFRYRVGIWNDQIQE
ncbi:glycosyltransferase, group 2 family protein [Dictyocaulus viviparus]|uniref:Glycosyltransferase, group 2 family protein n=1 Tax=Dictyocaulus viviparus TaxID=29172 RepID=A0A0D8YFK0_DICVI|nr:glycosyltransferase, group 2 family protein [Dictyocaulus viviparus]